MCVSTATATILLAEPAFHLIHVEIYNPDVILCATCFYCHENDGKSMCDEYAEQCAKCTNAVLDDIS